jgi:hypothetical protein
MFKRMTERPYIGILVDRDMERRLQRAIPYVQLVVLSDWLELAFFDLESSPWGFIVDPMLLPAEHRRETMGRLGKRRGVPVILYAKMTPDFARVALELGQLGIRYVMFPGVGDRPDEVRTVLVKALSQCIRQEQS